MITEQTLKDLAEKFGLMLNWGDENVVPYLRDLSKRVITFKIRESIFWIVLGVLVIIFGIIFFIIAKKIDDDREGGGAFALAICAVAGMVILGANVYALILYTALPEKAILDFIK